MTILARLAVTVAVAATIYTVATAFIIVATTTRSLSLLHFAAAVISGGTLLAWVADRRGWLG